MSSRRELIVRVLEERVGNGTKWTRHLETTHGTFPTESGRKAV
jgi:hypothetical protein